MSHYKNLHNKRGKEGKRIKEAWHKTDEENKTRRSEEEDIATEHYVSRLGNKRKIKQLLSCRNLLGVSEYQENFFYLFLRTNRFSKIYFWFSFQNLTTNSVCRVFILCKLRKDNYYILSTFGYNCSVIINLYDLVD